MRRLALSVACAALLPGASHSQQLPPQIPPLDAHVRVLLRDSTRAHGKLIAAPPQTITLRRLVGANDAEIVDRTIPRDSILTVWRRAGTRWAVGAVIGAPIAIASLIVAAA